MLCLVLFSFSGGKVGQKGIKVFKSIKGRKFKHNNNSKPSLGKNRC